MTWEPRYKEVTIAVLEVVPPRELLPECTALMRDDYVCPNKAKYMRDGQPVCGRHLATPNQLFL